MLSPAILDHLRQQGNRALTVGGATAAVFGYLIGGFLAVVLATGGGPFFVAPCAFSFLCGAYSTLLFVLARRQRIHGPLAWVVMFGFVSLPTLFFAVAQRMLPIGAAGLITGAIPYLYAFLVVISGFLFDPRLPIACGALAGAEFVAVYLVARPSLLAQAIADPVLREDLTSPVVYLIKGLMMVIVGVATGAIARITRRLLVRVLDEEREKQFLSGLFDQYVSAEVRQAIVRHARESRGERRQVALLFSDLRGFTSFSEGRDPAEVVARLNEYFGRMVEAIAQEGGVVDKFIGDAVMAVFGGVLALPDPAGASVRAARRMRAALAELNARWRERGLDGFESGIGIHFGEVLQGPIGSEHRREFTVIGDAVNAASRLEGLTKDRQVSVLISGELHERLAPADRAGFQPLGESAVKGRRQPIVLHGASF